MSGTNQIAYLKNHEINKALWNACIGSSINGLIYGRSIYLDKICRWDALVLNNYEAVMPLSFKTKWGISYLYQPFFAASLGIFGKTLNEEITKLFLQNIPSYFRYWNIDLNEENKIEVFDSALIHKRKNLFINLNSPYHQLNANYSRLAKRKLRSGIENKLQVEINNDWERVIDLYMRFYEENKTAIPLKAYQILKAAMAALSPSNYKAYFAKKEDNIVAFYLVLCDEKYVYSFIGGSTKQGKESGAFYLLTDAAIQDFSNTNKIFRFEGSDKEGIAFFNQQFGPYPVSYPHIKMNKLPWPLKWLK